MSQSHATDLPVFRLLVLRTIRTGHDPHLQKYHVRHRVYDPREGRWMQNDPLGFGAGDQDLYRYCGGAYSMGYDPLGLESGMGETITTGGDGCVCGDDDHGGAGNVPQGRRGDIFDQLGVGEDRRNGNTRAGQRERSDDSIQFGRNVTGVAYGLNNGISDAVGGFVSMFNPVNILQAIQSANKRLNALAEGDPLPMLDFLLTPYDAANGIADRWNNASEEERYYMVSYGTGYVGTTAALTYATGAGGRAIANAAEASAVSPLLRGLRETLHHVATDKHPRYWTPQFNRLLAPHGLTVKDLPAVSILGHAGPHSWMYHDAVYLRLQGAAAGLSGAAARRAILAESEQIARDCARVGSQYNQWVTTRVRDWRDSFPPHARPER